MSSLINFIACAAKMVLYRKYYILALSDNIFATLDVIASLGD
jgi:hypothetical protein